MPAPAPRRPLPEPSSIQTWAASDGSYHQLKSDAALHEIKLRLTEAFLAVRPGQIGEAQRFAAAAIDAAADIAPLLEQVPAARSQ